MRIKSLNSQLWRNACLAYEQEEITLDTAVYLIFDDTVINKKYRYKIEIVRRQYRGDEHKVICVLSATKLVV